MSRTRSGVFAPFAAAVMISLALVAPAAAEPAAGSGQETSSSASNGKSASRESNGKSASRDSNASAHRSSVGQRQSDEARSRSTVANSGTERTSSASGSAVQLDRPNDFQAQADPDGDTNGGVDQPGGQGGVDPTAQDGNNGTGNDIDCEDDNRGQGVPGHCEEQPQTERGPQETALAPEVLGVQAIAPGAVPAEVAGTEAVAPAEAQVLGVQRTAAPSTGILPQTGATTYLALVGLAGLALAAAGALTMLFRRRVRHGR